MSEERYNVVFKGELVRSFELDAVKKNVGQLFKMSGPKLEALFSGKTIILKRNVNFEAANKYRVAIKKAGARVDLVEVPVAEEAPTTAPKEPAAPKPSLGKATFGEQPSQAEAPVPSASVTASAETASDDNFSLAPVGSDVLSESERQHLPVIEVDTSGLSVKESDGELLDPSEKVQVEAPVLDLSGMDVAPQEGNLLRDDERPQVEAVAVDTSALSVADPGERLEAPKPPPPPAPDVSNIRLEE